MGRASKSDEKIAEENARYDKQNGKPETKVEPKPSSEHVRFLMPFGKYKGKPIEDTPTQYLLWLLKQEFVNGRTRDTIADHIYVRFQYGESRPGASDPPW